MDRRYKFNLLEVLIGNYTGRVLFVNIWMGPLGRVILHDAIELFI